jgi:glycosyltransferase involved in cell wall biosynthesis/peptidoglycan/xylan/chitin deacetylase (PgdA/CDA1 family)
MPTEILLIVNSVFGARKAPGFRPYQLVRFGTCWPRVIARGAAVEHEPMHFPLPGRSLIPRGLNFMRIKLLPGLPAREIEQGLFDRLCLWQSRRLKETPRLVHLWDHLPLTAAYWKARGVPVLVDLHMAHPRCYQPLVAAGRIEAASVGSLEDPAADRCIALADLLVCPSVFVRDSLPEVDQARAVVIPFGADAVPAVPVRADRTGPVRVLFAGNINQRKGVPFLLAAWRALALPPDQAELVLCGRQFAEAADWVRQAPPGVRFAGFQADMAPYFAEADLFVLPSLMEGSAKAVYEAMAAGLPAVVTPHTGSVIEDGVDGLVVPPADAGSLADALQRLISDRALRERLGDRARQTAQHYSWEAYARAVAGLYDRWPVSAGAGSATPVVPAAVSTEAATTYFGHMAPRPLLSKVRMLADHGRLAVKAWPRRVDTAGAWLRFPFYHHVFDDERRGFARHLDSMRNYGEFIGLDDAVRLIEEKTPLDGRYLCLGFDDGFRCGLTGALPILAERSISAAFFIVSGLVSEQADDCTAEHRRFFGPGRRPVPFLTWDDCRTLLAAGMTIGSHSASHRPLIKLGDAEARDELAVSKAAIEAALGRSCDHFCCPWGKPDRDFKTGRDPETARALGYRSFLTTKYGSMHPGDSPFAIRRVGLVARFGVYQLRYFLSL